MTNTHRKTLTKLFQDPIPANLSWWEIENLFLALGAIVKEGRGSRIRVKFPDVPPAVFHRPHPRNEVDKGAVKSVRRLLIDANIVPEDFS
jgi:hypothetical protein